MADSPQMETRFVVRAVVGAILLLTGLVLWVFMGDGWLGLISGVGVVLLYSGFSPQIEERRSR